VGVVQKEKEKKKEALAICEWQLFPVDKKVHLIDRE
jgi:hypothetical protein